MFRKPQIDCVASRGQLHFSGTSHKSFKADFSWLKLTIYNIVELGVFVSYGERREDVMVTKGIYTIDSRPQS